LKEAASSIGPIFTSCSKGNASNNSTEIGELLKKYSTDGVKLTSLLTSAFNAAEPPVATKGTFNVPLHREFCVWTKNYHPKYFQILLSRV
jgi:hypothetical protein